MTGKAWGTGHSRACCSLLRSPESQDMKAYNQGSSKRIPVSLSKSPPLQGWNSAHLVNSCLPSLSFLVCCQHLGRFSDTPGLPRWSVSPPRRNRSTEMCFLLCPSKMQYKLSRAHIPGSSSACSSLPMRTLGRFNQTFPPLPSYSKLPEFPHKSPVSRCCYICL